MHSLENKPNEQSVCLMTSKHENIVVNIETLTCQSMISSKHVQELDKHSQTSEVNYLTEQTRFKSSLAVWHKFGFTVVHVFWYLLVKIRS